MRSKSIMMAIIIATFVFTCWAERGLADGGYVEDFSEEQGWYSEIWDPRGFIVITEEDKDALSYYLCPITAKWAVVEVDIVFTEHTNGLAGLVLRPEPEDTGSSYIIHFDPDGYYTIAKRLGTQPTWKFLRRWQNTSFINQGLMKLNHLRLEIQDKQLRVYINGHSVTFLNAEIHEGKVGVLVGNFSGVTTARFDNLSLQETQSRPEETVLD